ncbi:hypothetical protein Golob_003064 [Gossypium lobatum]|uniref:Uncharacterized protein n=1 Tax=Gossypium lobatum TaxID=34289 RepID=A0A7J8N700_9ROSI|nr:hypothetical protein [Gossypium lobatum]
MEATATQKKKGFFKNKLLVLPKSFSRDNVTNSGSTVGQNIVKANYSTIITVVSKQTTGCSNQHKVVSYFNKSPSFYDHKGYANETWGRGDDHVDSMATTFISNVRRRFELDGGFDSTARRT